MSDTGLPPELRNAIKDVERLDDEIDNIMDKASEFSEKTEKFSKAFSGLSKAIGGGTAVAAKNVAKNRGFKAGAKTAGGGALAAGAAAAIGWGINKAGEIYEDYKKRKAMKNKKNLAKKKIDSVSGMVERLEKRLSGFDRFIQNDAPRTFSQSRWERYDDTLEQIENIFQGYYQAKLSLTKARYLIAQFRAWINDNWESQYDPPTREEVLEESLKNLARYSQIEDSKNHDHYEVSEYVTVGGLYLIKNSNQAKQLQKVNNFAKFVAKDRARAGFFRFGGKRKKFREFYDEYLSGSGEVSLKTNFYQISYIILLLIISGVVWYSLEWIDIV
jgi:hypothetical protein